MTDTLTLEKMTVQQFKAWIVRDSSDHCQVFFADTEEGAWNQWIQEEGDCEGCAYGDCPCYGMPEINHEPRFDQYASIGKVPLQGYLDAWWGWKCEICAPDLLPEEFCGPGDWQIVEGRALCNECAEIETKQPDRSPSVAEALPE